MTEVKHGIQTSFCRWIKHFEKKIQNLSWIFLIHWKMHHLCKILKDVNRPWRSRRKMTNNKSSFGTVVINICWLRIQSLSSFTRVRFFFNILQVYCRYILKKDYNQIINGKLFVIYRESAMNTIQYMLGMLESSVHPGNLVQSNVFW